MKSPIQSSPRYGEDNSDPVAPEPNIIFHNQPEGDPPLHTRTCTPCSKEYQAPKVWHPRGHWMDYGNECPDCARVRMSGKYAASTAAKSRLWEKCCPPGYRDDARVKAIPKALSEFLKDVRKRCPDEGILLHGPTGRFKTTAMLNLVVKWLFHRNHKPLYLTAMSFRAEASKWSKDGRLESWLREIRAKPWIFFDDFGNGADTPAALEALHSLTEYRRGRNLPMLVTTQFSDPVVMMERFKTNPTQGKAIIERLKTLAPHRFDVADPTLDLSTK